jgi:hypothetical protein
MVYAPACQQVTIPEGKITVRIRKILIAAGSAVAVVMGGGALALAVPAAISVTPPTITACVSATNVVQHLYAHSHTCPAGQHKITWNQRGPQGIQGVQGIQGPAGPSDLSLSAMTSVSNRDDSGGNGNWATDAMIRSVSITRHEAAAVSNCGGAVATCYYYTGTLTDSGTFVTQDGAFTPNQGLHAGQHISGTVQGNFTGGTHLEFYASSAAPSASGVVSTVSGDSPSTTNWVEQFFPGGTSFSSINLIDWSWSYNAPNTCESWVDAASNSGGQSAGAGDITGVNHC